MLAPKLVTLPELGMIAGTRAAFGAGVGLLLAGWLSPEQRRAVGWTLCAVGALSTIPRVSEIMLRGSGGESSLGVGGRPSAPAGGPLFPE